MQETIRTRREQEAGPRGLGNIFGGGAVSAPMATVMSGPYAEQLPVGNMTVGEIRRRFRDRFDIAPNSQATLDAHEAGEDTVVRAGQVLSFIRHAGEKGATPRPWAVHRVKRVAAWKPLPH